MSACEPLLADSPSVISPLYVVVFGAAAKLKVHRRTAARES